MGILIFSHAIQYSLTALELLSLDLIHTIYANWLKVIYGTLGEKNKPNLRQSEHIFFPSRTGKTIVI